MTDSDRLFDYVIGILLQGKESVTLTMEDEHVNLFDYEYASKLFENINCHYHVYMPNVNEIMIDRMPYTRAQYEDSKMILNYSDQIDGDIRCLDDIDVKSLKRSCNKFEMLVRSTNERLDNVKIRCNGRLFSVNFIAVMPTISMTDFNKTAITLTRYESISIKRLN